MDTKVRHKLEALCRLALDPSIGDGEAQAAAWQFFRSLRANRITFEAFTTTFERIRVEKEVVIVPAGQMRMPFGKYKGAKLIEIRAQYPDYLEWVLDNCKLSSALEREIEKVLYGDD